MVLHLIPLLRMSGWLNPFCSGSEHQNARCKHHHDLSPYALYLIALRLWGPPIHVAMSGHRPRRRQPNASAENNVRRLPGSDGRAARGTEAGADIRGLWQQNVMEAGSKEVGQLST